MYFILTAYLNQTSDISSAQWPYLIMANIGKCRSNVRRHSSLGEWKAHIRLWTGNLTSVNKLYSFQDGWERRMIRKREQRKASSSAVTFETVKEEKYCISSKLRMNFGNI